MTAVIVIIFPDHTVAVFCDYIRKNLQLYMEKLFPSWGNKNYP